MMDLGNLSTAFVRNSLAHQSTPLHIVPEWYFLCQYAMLKAVPNKNAGFIILLTVEHHKFLDFMFFSAGDMIVPVSKDKTWLNHNSCYS